ncbi:class A beta-lactamase [Enterobacterales bacterium AW_CKDN230030176-1A_HGKHYDSX7]
MRPVISRRLLLAGAVGGAAALTLPVRADDAVHRRLAQLEHDHGRTLGLWALDTGSGQRLAYRADRRFAFCSAFKVVLAGAILHRHQTEPGLLERHVHYDATTLVTYSPITERHLETGLRVADLCAAALQYSDNTAANLLLAQVGGPAGVTAFARRLGDAVFRLDRDEPTLNTALPDDPRDTTTPLAMGMTLQRLLLGEALAVEGRRQLQTWLEGNTTGATRIQAGVPTDWRVGDKTGTGDYGVANDVGIVWPPDRAPWIVAVFTRGPDPSSPGDSALIAAAMREVVQVWG